MPTKQVVTETAESLKRMQGFDAKSLARTEELSRNLNFQDGVAHAETLIELFRQISTDILPELSDQKLQVVKQQADAQFNIFQQILSFTDTQQNPKQARDNLVQQLAKGYDSLFENLWPVIAYSARRATDFARLEREARAAIQSISDRTAAIETDLKQRQQEAETALDAIRKVAAEQGVSQQAIYFKQEGEAHAEEARTWLTRTAWLTVGLAVYAACTFILHKLPWLTPITAYETVQLSVSKVLVFATIGYFLVLSARNYMAHRHNAVVNKHRQNSLMTYSALVEAAGDHANRDIVLGKAAESVFGSQATGFAKEGGDEGRSLSMVNLNPALLRASS